LKAGSTRELAAAIERVAAGGTYVDPRLDRVLRSARSAARVPQLSPRERQVMHLMAEGLTADGVGAQLGVSVETVRTHVRNAIRKLQARNRVNAIAIALERGEIALDPRSER
jgi:DNA-binding NarL/FixJ family response regulator